jgi:hypothetical protein
MPAKSQDHFSRPLSEETIMQDYIEDLLDCSDEAQLDDEDALDSVEW